MVFTLPLSERDRRWKKIRREMELRQLQCLLIWGSYGYFRHIGANIKYLSNATAEGYLLFPLESEPTLYTFMARRDPEFWVSDCRSGHPAYSEAISERLKELHLESANIGIVGLSGYLGEVGFPHATYTSLTSNLPKAKLKDATEILEQARLIKSAAEIRCLELGCEVADKVVQAIVDKARVGIGDYEIISVITDTLLRNDCEPGSMILYYSGKEGRHAGEGGHFQTPSKRVLELGDVILVEFDAKYLGYVAQYNQTFSVGEPSQEWKDIFAVSVEAFNTGIKKLKSGVTVGELDEAFLSPIKKAGYTYRTPAFHGLGLALEMPMGSFPAQPLHKPNNSFRIEAGMVIEPEPHVLTMDGKKGIHIGCPLVVTDEGSRLLSKTWKPELKIIR